MSVEQGEPGGVALDLVALSEALAYIEIQTAALSAAMFGPPMLWRAPGTDGSGGTGITEVFLVPPDEDALFVPADDEPFLVLGVP